MGRISHHLKGKDYKKTHQRCLDEQRALYLEKREKEIQEEKKKKNIEEAAKPFKSNWKKELSEAMTTAAILSTTIPASSSSLENISISDKTLSSTNASVTNGGGGTGYNTGLNLGAEMISISGGNQSAKSFSLGTFDTSRATTVTFKSQLGDYNNGGMASTEDTEIYFVTDTDIILIDTIPSNYDNYFGHSGSSHPDYPFKAGLFATMTSAQEDELRSDFSDYVSGGFKSADQFAIYGKIVRFLGIQQQVRNHTYTIPANLRGTGQIIITQAKNTGTSWTNDVAFSNFEVKRTTPINVFVGLDDPEATNFIRTDPIMRGLSADERRKKLEDMLDSGDEYLLKQVGLQGSTARPADTGNVQSWEQSAINFDQQKLEKDVAWLKGMGKSFAQGYLGGRTDAEANAIRSALGMQTRSTSSAQAKFNSLPDYEKAWLNKMGPAFTQGYLGTSPSQPPTQSQPQNQPTPQQLANIEASLKQLEIDKENDKKAAVARNLEFAANLAMDAATVAALLSPIPGDEAAILAARGGQLVKQGGGQLVKQGAKQTAFDKAEAEVIKRTAKATAEKAARRSPARTSQFNFDMNRMRDAMQSGIKPGRLYQSYEPQGQVISEKKLKSPKEVLKDKIPGYYDGKPAPLGFPDNPPPEMVNGMHPDLVDGKKVADRFNRLDPQSAQAMPLTGNPHIDKKVLKARKQPK